MGTGPNASELRRRIVCYPLRSWQKSAFKQSLAGNLAGKTRAGIHNTVNLFRKSSGLESSSGHSNQIITEHY